LFQQARSEHRKGAALADLRSALEGKLSTDLDAQVLIPHLSETRSSTLATCSAISGGRHRLNTCRATLTSMSSQ
jgi:hypothetical protein